MRGNLARHARRAIDVGERRHAAVAIVVVDSDAVRDGVDPLPAASGRLDMVPGDVTGLDGSMNGVAGGAAFLLCRRASTMRNHAGQWALLF